MTLLIKLLAILGLADAAWMAVDPASWGRFWERFMGKLRQGGIPPRLLSLFQASVSLYLLLRK